MKKIFLSILSVCFLLSVTVYQFTQITPAVAANNPTLKVLSFNVHYDENFKPNHLRPIAEYIKANNIEVAGLQELNTSVSYKATPILEQLLKEIGYPMYVAVNPNREVGYFENAVFSKYPIQDAQYLGQNPCYDGRCRRWAVVTKIATPIGNVRFTSTHVHHGDDNCQSLAQFAALMAPYQNEALIMTGDFNTRIGRCGGFIENTYNYACVDQKNCLNDSIDWVFLSKSNTLLEQVYRIKDPKFTVSDHLPIIAEIRSTVPLKQGDLDNDGDVDVFDYNILLGKFGATGVPGFHVADIVQNGSVDIFDYNKLVENFGK